MRTFTLAIFDIILLLLPKKVDLIWSQYTVIALLFLMGFVSFIGVVAGYQSFCDYAPSNMHPTLGMGWNIGEGIVVIIASLYYRYLSLDWAGLIWFTVVLYIFFGIG